MLSSLRLRREMKKKVATLAYNKNDERLVGE